MLPNWIDRYLWSIPVLMQGLPAIFGWTLYLQHAIKERRRPTNLAGQTGQHTLKVQYRELIVIIYSKTWNQSSSSSTFVCELTWNLNQWGFLTDRPQKVKVNNIRCTLPSTGSPKVRVSTFIYSLYKWESEPRSGLTYNQICRRLSGHLSASWCRSWPSCRWISSMVWTVPSKHLMCLKWRK